MIFYFFITILWRQLGWTYHMAYYGRWTGLKLAVNSLYTVEVLGSRQEARILVACRCSGDILPGALIVVACRCSWNIPQEVLHGVADRCTGDIRLGALPAVAGGCTGDRKAVPLWDRLQCWCILRTLKVSCLKLYT